MNQHMRERTHNRPSRETTTAPVAADIPPRLRLSVCAVPRSVDGDDGMPSQSVSLLAAPWTTSRVTSRRRRTFVVGYDGSPAARAAVIQAARRGGDDGHVFVVYAYTAPPGYLGQPYYDRRLSEARRHGTTVLGALLGEHRDELPETDYVEELLGGPPAEAINNVAKARNAEAIVVGSSNTSRLRRRLCGSVPRTLVRIADRPVLITPASTSLSERASTAPSGPAGE